MMSNLGLILIIVGWLWQWRAKNQKIQPTFVILYGIGVIFLVIDGVRSGLYTLAILNLLSFTTAALVFLKIKHQK